MLKEGKAQLAPQVELLANTGTETANQTDCSSE